MASKTNKPRVYTDIDAMVKDLQDKRSLDDLFAAAPGAQLALTRAVIRAALESFPQTEGKSYELMAQFEKEANDKKLSPKPDKNLAHVFNDYAKTHGLDAVIIANGPKQRDRALQKQKTKGAKDNHITDLIRVKVCSKESPEAANHIVTRLSEVFDHTEPGRLIRSGGMLGTDYRIAVDGLMAQVHLSEPGQIRADAMSHGIYELRREFAAHQAHPDPKLRDSIIRRYNAWSRLVDDMMDPDFSNKLRPYPNIGTYVDHLSAGTLTDDEKIKFIGNLEGGQNLRLVSEFMREHKGATGFSRLPPLAKDANDFALNISLEHIQQLHQIIHVAHISHASKPWRQLYVDEADKMNRNAGREVIPNRFLDLIPDVTRGQGEGKER